MSLSADVLRHLKRWLARFMRSGNAIADFFLKPTYVDEFTNPAAPDDDSILASGVTSTTSVQSISGASLNGVIGTGAISPPRNLTITLNSHADWDATTLTIAGTDIEGAALSEDFSVPNGGNTVLIGSKAFKTVTSVAIAAQSGTNGTIKIGTGRKIGLTKKAKLRGGIVALVREIAATFLIAPGTYECEVKRAADATAGTATGETSIAVCKRACRLVAAYYLPDAALTASATDNATITIKKYDSAGANGATIATLTTDVAGGSWTQWAPKSIPPTTTETALTHPDMIAAGSNITYAITKAASGVTVPAGSLVLVFSEGGTMVIPATGAPHGTYEPVATPDAALDYSIEYEVDVT